MRKSNVLVLLTAITLAPATGLAQSAPPPSATCSGGITGTVGLAVPDGTGSLRTVEPAAVPYVFGAAECQCGTTDIEMQIRLTTALPVGSVGTVEVWAGPSCDVYAQRTTGTPIPCQKIATLDINDFTTSSTAGANGINVPIPSAALFSPNVSPALCTEAALSNSLYVFIYTDPANPTSTCMLPLTEENQGPTPSANITASPDASGSPTAGVKVAWTLPVNGTYNPNGTALLCADSDGKPEPIFTIPAPYSVCLNGKIDRRGLPSSGTQVIAANFTAPTGTLASLDPHYLCGYENATVTSATLPLDPTKAHQIIVASVDNFGNITGTQSVQTGGITPVGDDMGTGGGGGATGSGKSHGCSMGGAAASSPWALAFVLLSLGAIVVRARRRRL